MLYPEINEARSIIDLSGAWNFRLDDGKHGEGYAYPSPCFPSSRRKFHAPDKSIMLLASFISG